MKNSLLKKIGVVMVAASLVVGGTAFAAKADSFVNQSSTMIADRVVETTNTVNKVKIGKSMSVIVDENATTGYSWKIKVEGDKKAVKTAFTEVKPAVAPTTDPNAPAICGAGVKKELKVTGVAKGKVTITMTYTRSFEKNVEPVKTMVFVVNVEK